MTLEQRRAAMAYAHLQEVTAEKDRKLYGSMAQKLPALIRSAGLCQALHFVKSRKEDALNLLLDHLGKQLKRVSSEIDDRESLCTKTRSAELADYVWLTRETLATVGWYGRLARSEWNVTLTDAPGR